MIMKIINTLAIMKKSILSICAIAAALLLAGCQKENINVVETAEATHTVVFTAEKMVDTKTAIASEENGMVSYKWIAGDENRMYITENYQNGEQAVVNRGTVTNMELTNADKTATFTVSFTGTAPTGDVSYKAAYAGQRSNANNPLIPSEQNPLPTSFDPNADVMVCVIDRTGREGNPTTLRFDMTRKVSVNKMTLKGLEEGEIISSVTFESDKNHSAYYNLNSGEYTSPFGKKLTFNYTDNNTVPSTGEFPVYFTTVPVTDATFTVSVVTNRHYYNKTSSRPISFELGNVHRFNVNLEGYTQKVFTLVTDPSQLQIGAEVVIAANGVKNAAMSTNQRDNNRGETPATKSDDRSKLTITDQVQVFTLVRGTKQGTYAFSFDNNGTTNYLYAASSSSNYLRSQASLDDNASWTISISSNEATIKAQGTNTHNILMRNASSEVYSCYISGQQTVYIYQASALPYPGMFWSAISANASMTTSSGIVFTAPTLNPGNATSISYDSSDTDVATIDASGVVTIIGAGTTTISAIFEGSSNYAPQTVTYTLTVTDDRETVATPTFNPASGVVDANTTVAISTQTSGATIHYTTDGSNPTTSSPVYSAPIVITSATTINAIAIKENYKDSEAASATYTVRGQSVNVWEDDFSTCRNSSVAMSSLAGSTAGFNGNYSNIGSVYPMNGAIRVGKASGTGRISTPVLANITGSSANLIVTFKAAGWDGKTAKLKLTVNHGSVTEAGQITIASESTMSGNAPSMVGTVYTFHITGANNTTKITFDTTNAIGIDDLVITQTN